MSILVSTEVVHLAVLVHYARFTVLIRVFPLIDKYSLVINFIWKSNLTLRSQKLPISKAMIKKCLAKEYLYK